MGMTQPESGVLIAGTIEPTINSSDRGKNAKECGEEIKILNGQSNHNIELNSKSALHTDKTIFGSSQLFEMSCAIHAICLLLTKSKYKIK